MKTLESIWPSHWSRGTKGSVTILVLLAALGALMGLLEFPLSYAPEPIGSNAAAFAAGARVTVEITLIAGISGVPIGMILALGKVSTFKPLQWFCNFYIWVIRGTPLLVQVLFFYFAVPALLPSIELSDYASACLALTVNIAAYNAEALRSGLLAIPVGQIEAARSLGLNRWYTALDVVIPQALRVSLPPLVNNIVSLLKDTSLAYTIGVVELTNIGNRIQSETFQPVPILITTALIYLVLTTVMTRITNAVERHFEVRVAG